MVRFIYDMALVIGCLLMLVGLIICAGNSKVVGIVVFALGAAILLGVQWFDENYEIKENVNG